MDLKRERATTEQWRNSGHRGKPPQPLMQLDELPECYQTDQPFKVKELDDSLEVVDDVVGMSSAITMVLTALMMILGLWQVF